MTQHPSSAGDSAPQRWVAVGIDGSATAVAALGYAIRMAAERHTDVLAVAAYEVPDIAVDLLDTARDSAHRAAVARLKGALAQVQIPAGMQVNELIAEGRPIEVLDSAEAATDVLVIGRHHVEWLPRWFGRPVASGVTAGAIRPVVVVPPGWNSMRFTGSPIVMALDGQTPARTVLRFTFGEAERRSASVLVLHTVEWGLTDAEFESARKTLEAILVGVRRQYPHIPLRIRMIPGDTADQLVHVSNGAGLVVVGQPHRTTARSWSRSVGRSILDRTNCPLAVVPA